MTIMPNFVVSIRNKTINNLGLKDNHDAQNSLANTIVNFRGFSYKAALDTIFAFVYGSEAREGLLNKFGFTACQEMAEKFDFLTNDQIVILGNELRYQYKESRPDFLKVEENPAYQEELTALEKALGNHPVLLYRVVEACKKCHDSHDIVIPCVEFLMSEDTASQKYGLQRMGNNEQYQNLLQPYAGKIGTLLQAMHNHYEDQQRIQAAQEELNSLHSPFTQISEQLNEKKQQEPAPENPAKEIIIPSEYSLSDELSKFISQKSEIVRNLPRDDEFWACLKRLRDIGVDLNNLLDNEQFLLPILEAHDTLDEATSALYDAEQDFDKAKANFQMSNIPSIHELSRAGANFENAKKAYSLALDTFVSHCRAYEDATK